MNKKLKYNKNQCKTAVCKNLGLRNPSETRQEEINARNAVVA